jgi:hypothetical protein
VKSKCGGTGGGGEACSPRDYILWAETQMLDLECSHAVPAHSAGAEGLGTRRTHGNSRTRYLEIRFLSHAATRLQKESG